MFVGARSLAILAMRLQAGVEQARIDETGVEEAGVCRSIAATAVAMMIGKTSRGQNEGRQENQSYGCSHDGRSDVEVAQSLDRSRHFHIAGEFP